MNKRLFCLINGALILLIAFFAGAMLAVKDYTEKENQAFKPQTVIHTSGTPNGTEVFSPSNKQTEYKEPEFTTSEVIFAINAGYEQMSAESKAHSESKIGDESIPTSNTPCRYELTDEERTAIENIVASEGGYCSYKFQALVAECILNGCLAENMRPLEIFNRGDFWLTNNVAPTDVTRQAVSDVFDKGVLPTADQVRYYYNPNFCESSLHESMCYVLTCCDCRFFKDWE